MSRNPLMFLTSTLVSVTLLASPMAAQAGGMSHMGSPGPGIGNLNCHPGTGGISHPGRPPGGNFGGNMTNINVYKPVNINKNIDVNNNINVYKPVTITKNIDIINNINNSKNININKNIDNSKNININKNIVINKSSSSSEALAIAAAIAAASSNSSSSVNFYGSVTGGNSSANAFSNSASFSNASAYNGGNFANNVGSVIAESPGMFGGELGAISVNVETPAPVAPQCTFQETTVIKAIHAVCVSADHHEFPASHMLGDTWIESSYEGEIARCLPGSHLKVAVGAVFQSSEGLASGWSHGQTLECGDHEAVRHFKGGMLRCAPALPVPDCTERTNLRKFGTGDMFFTYRTKVCMETHEEYSETEGHTEMSREDDMRGYSRAGSY